MMLLRSILFGLLLLTGACSMERALEAMSSPEDRAFARAFVDDVRAGRFDRLEPQFHPQLWAKSTAQLPVARSFFPAGEAETKLIGYQVKSQVGTGGNFSTKEYVLVTTDGKRWTETELATETRDGTTAIVAWNVEPFDEPPPNLRRIEQYEAALPWIRVGAIVALLAVGSLIFWLIRRSRRRRSV